MSAGNFQRESKRCLEFLYTDQSMFVTPKQFRFIFEIRSCPSITQLSIRPERETVLSFQASPSYA